MRHTSRPLSPHTDSFHRFAAPPTLTQPIQSHLQPVSSPRATAPGHIGGQADASCRQTEQRLTAPHPWPAQPATTQPHAAPHVPPETLTQVAAAAAVAAAQAVKHDADSELSQVLKAVLLQQSRMGIANSALANAVGPGMFAAMVQEKPIGPRVVGHRLTEAAPHAPPPPHSATPVVCLHCLHDKSYTKPSLILIPCIADAGHKILFECGLLGVLWRTQQLPTAACGCHAGQHIKR